MLASYSRARKLDALCRMGVCPLRLLTVDKPTHVVRVKTELLLGHFPKGTGGFQGEFFQSKTGSVR